MFNLAFPAYILEFNGYSFEMFLCGGLTFLIFYHEPQWLENLKGEISRGIYHDGQDFAYMCGSVHAIDDLDFWFIAVEGEGYHA